MALVEKSLTGKTGVLQLNRPEKHNSLSGELMREMTEALDELAAGGVHVIVIRAARGVKVWSAGHDINEIPEPRRDPLGYFDALETLLRKIQDCPVPVIAMVEGSVWGGACDLCAACDLIIAAQGSSFAMTPAKIGIPYNPSGLIHFINILGLNKAKEMFFTAEPITARDSFNLGILNHLVPAAEIEGFTIGLVEKIRRNSPLAIRSFKRQFRLLSGGQPLSAEAFELIQSIRREVYDSQDYAEGIRAFHEKRPPVFRGE